MLLALFILHVSDICQDLKGDAQQEAMAVFCPDVIYLTTYAVLCYLWRTSQGIQLDNVTNILVYLFFKNCYYYHLLLFLYELHIIEIYRKIGKRMCKQFFMQ